MMNRNVVIERIIQTRMTSHTSNTSMSQLVKGANVKLLEHKPTTTPPRYLAKDPAEDIGDELAVSVTRAAETKHRLSTSRHILTVDRGRVVQNRETTLARLRWRLQGVLREAPLAKSVMVDALQRAMEDGPVHAEQMSLPLTPSATNAGAGNQPMYDDVA